VKLSHLLFLRQMSTPGSVKIWLARWALRCEQPREFTPRDIAAWLLKWLLPDERKLPTFIAALFGRLFLSHLDAREITDGNVNFSFCVTGRFGHQIFVKQAHGFLKWQPQMKLERERMAREIRYYSDAARALGGDRAAEYLPRIVHFDAESTVVVMEYLSGFRVLFDVIFEEGSVPRAAAVHLGTYLGHVHLASLVQSSPTAVADSAVAYWNPALRAIQLEHVFSICFTHSTRGRTLAEDPAVMREVSLLRAKYLGYTFDPHDRLVLCHGDLHPGSVMISEDGSGRVKVIDPEFCAYAPPGLDVGSLFSGFVLAHLFRCQVAPAASRPEGTLVALNEAIETLWGAYVQVLRTREAVNTRELERIETDAVGFCLMEVCRTALGFAGARDPSRRIASSAALEAYQEVAVGLVTHCLTKRNAPAAAGGGVGCLFAALRDTTQLTRALTPGSGEGDHPDRLKKTA